MGSFFLKEEGQRRETEKEISEENALHNCCHKVIKPTFRIIAVHDVGT